MKPEPGELDGMEMDILGIHEEPEREGYRPIGLVVSFGRVDCRYYPAAGARGAAVFVGGAGGGWDTPARNLYPRLCGEFAGREIASLRVRFRDPIDLEESVRDVRAGLLYLHGKGFRSTALVGHSFGGAVAIRAAASDPGVRTVVALATQSYGTQPAARLGPDCSILLLHGMADHVLPADCSRQVHAAAQEPKRILLYPGAGHVLDEIADDVYATVRDWIVAEMARAAA